MQRQAIVLIPSSSGQKLKIKIETANPTKKARSHQLTFSLHDELQAAAKRSLGVNDELVVISFNESEVDIECYSRDVCLRIYSNSFQIAGNAERIGASIVVLRVNGAVAKKIPVALMLHLGQG